MERVLITGSIFLWVETTMAPISNWLVNKLITGNQENWEKYVQHPFVKALAEGTLKPENYIRYTA